MYYNALLLKYGNSFLENLCFVLLPLAGELYVQAQKMFDDRMYTQLLAIIDLAVKQTMITHDNYEIEFVSL